MRVNSIARRPAPARPWTDDLVEVDHQAVPFMLTALWFKSQQGNWAVGDDVARGRQLMNKQGAQLLMGATQRLIDASDRLYTLLDAGIFGTNRDVTGTGTDVDPFVYEPPITQTKYPSEQSADGLLRYGFIGSSGLTNLITGEGNIVWPADTPLKDLLRSIIDSAGASGELDDEILAKLAEAVVLLA